MGQNRILAAISGLPKGMPRARSRYVGGKVYYYTPSTGVQEWKAAIAQAIESQVPEQPWDGPVMVSMTFHMKRPKRMMTAAAPECELWHSQKPDIDNLMKAVLDVCTEQHVWHDDDQVSFVWAKKYWMEKDGEPGMFLAIKPMEEQEQEWEDEIVVELP